MEPKTIGKYAFWLGLILAVLIALVPEENMSEWVVWAMILLGLVGGYLRVSKESELHFFMMTLALAVFSDALFALPTVGEFLTDILFGVATFLGAAVIAVVVRNIVSWFR